jgi:Recombination directionality factor-like
MSLQNIVEIVSPAGPMLIELGKIKIGAKQKQVRTSAGGVGWRAPEKHDHFTITTMNRDTTGDLVTDKNLMDQLIAEFGDPDGKLRQIPVRMLSDDLDEVLQAGFVWYGGKSVGARSDGKVVTWLFDHHPQRFGQKLAKPVEEKWSDEFLKLKSPKGGPLFKLHATLNCVIAARQAKFGGVYKFRTTSVISFRQLYGSLLHVSNLTGGILAGMPLVLVLRPIQVSPGGKVSTVYVVHAELRGADLGELQQQALLISQSRVKQFEQVQENRRAYQKLLMAPGTESAAEAAEIADEFVPDGPVIETIAENVPYSLIDGPPKSNPPAAPAESAEPLVLEKPAQIADGPEAPAPVLDTWDAQAPSEDHSNPACRDTTSKSETLASEETEQQIADWLGRPWDECQQALYAAASRATPDLDESVFTGGLEKYMRLRGFHRRENKLTLGGRRLVYDAMAAGRFDFKSGNILAVEIMGATT